MKLYSLITAVLAGCAMYAPKTSAQTTVTNAILTAALNLTGYIQQPTNSSPLPTVKIQKFTTKDVVASLEQDLGLPTNDLATAKILLKFSRVGNTGTNAILNTVLRTSGGDTNIDGIFVIDVAHPAVGDISVRTVRSNSNGTAAEFDFVTFFVSLTTSNLSFTAQGRMLIAESSITAGKTIIDPRAFPTSYAVALTGSGKVGTNSTVFTGTFNATNRKVETVASQ